MSAIGREVLGRLLDEHGRALQLFARQWCLNSADVVQEAFVRLIGQPAAPDNVVGWLYRVVRNGAVSSARADNRRRRHETAAGTLRDNWFEPSADAEFDGEAVTEALSGLPVEQRETIVARLWGGLSFDQIAVVTETSSSTAHRHYQAGLAAIRKQLGVACHKNTSTDES